MLTGYAGQLSLAQFALAGFGAYVAGRARRRRRACRSGSRCCVGVAATVPLGVLFALPAVRTRGINLAIVTLGLGTAIELMLFRNTELHRRHSAARRSATPTLFGLDINAITHPTRYGLVRRSPASCSRALVVVATCGADAPAGG